MRLCTARVCGSNHVRESLPRSVEAVGLVSRFTLTLSAPKWAPSAAYVNPS